MPASPKPPAKVAAPVHLEESRRQWAEILRLVSEGWTVPVVYGPTLVCHVVPAGRKASGR